MPHWLSVKAREHLFERYSIPLYAEQMELAFTPHLSVRLSNVRFGIPLNKKEDGKGNTPSNQVLNEERVYLSVAKLSADLDISEAVSGRWSLRAINVENTSLQIPQLQESLAAVMQMIRPADDISRHISFHNATIKLKDVELNFAEPDLINGKLVIDQMLVDLQGHETSRMGARWFSHTQPQPAPPTIEVSGLIRVPNNDNPHWQVHELTGEMKGRIGNYPWTIRSTVNESTLFGGVRLGIKLTNLRSYIRRNDAPDDHQATISAAELRWGLADGRAQFMNGVWTYTDHNATAWKFDATADMAMRRVIVHSKSMDGSATEAFTEAVWQLPCHTPTTDGWVWRKGWFEHQATAEKPKKSQWIFCK